MRSQRSSIMFGRTRIDFMVQRSPRRKTISLSVGPGEAVAVIGPKGLRLSDAARAVRAKATWIVGKRVESRRRRTPVERRFVSGEAIPYLGRQYQLKVRRVRGAPRNAADLRWHRGQFDVTIPPYWSEARARPAIRSAVVSWLRKRAVLKSQTLCGGYSRQLGVNTPQVKAREMHGRWASCTPGGTALVNWRLVMAPRRLVEYVCAHEVCHLVHPDHSAAFWRLLRTVIPDADARQHELAQIGPSLNL